MASLNNTLFLPTNGNLHKSLHCSKPDPFKEKKHAQVDYDAGTHKVYTRIPGLRKLDLPKRQRFRVDGDRFQKDWTLSEVVERITELKHWEDVEGMLNQWAGRFARKNFPVLMREIIQMGSIEHAIQVFNWMKNQKNYCARNDIYNMLIRLHARHNRIDQARGLFFEMQKWRCNPDVETYNALINAHGRAGQWRWGVNIMEDMLRASSCRSFSILLSLYMRMPDVILCHVSFLSRCVFDTFGTWIRRAIGFSTLQLPPRIPPSRSTYNNLINACGSSGNWREALKISKKMTDNGVGPDLVTHNIILSAYKTGAQYSKALAYFELMKSTNVRSDTTTLNIVIDCLVKFGKYKEAIEIFNSMREKRAECHPDIVTYTSIMHMYSVSGQIDNCRAVFDALVAEGMKPNVISYNALLGAYASLGLSESVSSLFDEMKRNGIRPDVVSYTSLINAYGRSRQPKKAWKIFFKMRRDNVSPNVVTYNALIDAYGSNGFLAEAVELLREMEQSGLQPNVVSISTLLAACGRCCQKSKIDSILKAAKMRGIVLNTIAYNSAIGSYMNVGEYDKALCMYRCMREKKIRPDSVTYNILISGSCKMSKYNEALEMISQLRELNIPWSKELYSSAICAYSKQGQLAEAESIFNMMKGAGFQPDVITYTTMLHAYSVGECWEKALAVFQDVELNNVQPDSVVCAALMRSFNKGSQPGKVLIVAEFMRDKKIPFTDAVFFEMVSSCSILRDWKRLTDVIEMMETTLPLISIGTLNLLLHTLGKVGNIDTMIKIFLKIVASGAEVEVTTYKVLLQNLLAAGNWRKYIEVMQWMEDAGVQPSAQIYDNILYFAQRSAGIKNAAVIRERIESLKGKSGYSTLERKRFDLPLPTHALISSEQT